MKKSSKLSASKQIFLLTILFGFIAIPVYAEWFKDYESAMDSVKKGQWAAAIPKLQAAIASKNEEGSNIKFYGMKFGDYFPHFYLGLSYFNQQNYQGAITEFETSERFGAIQKKSDLYARLNNVRTLCKAQTATPNPPIAQNNPPNIVTPPVEKKEEPPKVITELPKEEPKKEEPKKVEPKTVQPEIKTQPENPTDINAESAKLIAKKGALKYFGGDFDEAIQLLSTATEMNPKSAPVQFLLGCSYASKYLLSGSQDQTLYDNATNAFQKSKRLKPSYQFNPAYFSPAILDIYQKAS